MEPTPPQAVELHAAAHWRVVDFISDLHLQAGEPATLQAWEHYMAHTRADAVFILGDLFEVWVGDDGLQGDDADARLERTCADILRRTSTQRSVCFMHGNRDFLLGPAFARDCRMTLLDDPTTLVFGGQRWLLTHGDMLCLDDIDYLRFRAEVRSTGWQQAFLGRPLAERRAIAHGLRQQSETRKRSGQPYADIDSAMATDWLQTARAAQLIHGHTHRPADHVLGPDRLRRVLSDWDAAATPPRAEVLRLSLPSTAGPVQVQRLAARAAV